MKTLVGNHLREAALARPETILVATDLTDMDYLMPHAIAQAKANGARITLVHALPLSNVVAVDGAILPTADRAKMVRDARLLLLELARQFEAEGIFCDIAVRDGIPADVIPEELNRIKASRLLMGTHGRGKLGQMALGSVSHNLITKVKVPVFVVGPHARSAADHAVPRRILFPVSLMGQYRESFNLAFEIAQAYRAELTLLHVLDRSLDQTIDPKRTIEWAKNALRALVPEATQPIPTVHVIVTSGRLADEILKEAQQTRADWIVLGAEGGSHAWSFNESAAYKVLTAASCPVLTLRHEPVPTQHVKMEEVHFTSPL